MARKLDLTGHRYGLLTVLQESKRGSARRSQWECQCDCGNIKIVGILELRAGDTKSCGCDRGNAKKINLTGHKFGRLTVLEEAPRATKGRNGERVKWLCQCDCGFYKSVTTKSLRNGDTVSCGCYAREVSRESRWKVRKHGESGTRLYRIWKGMRHRCNLPSEPAYRFYGARGVTVCADWNDDYKVFANWARSHGYQENLTIERIDPTGNYEPANCTWIPHAQQGVNKRTTLKLTAFGMTKTLKEWSKDSRCKAPIPTIRYRLGAGWDPEEAISRIPFGQTVKDTV